MLIYSLVLESVQSLLNLICINTNILEAIKQMDVCISVEEKGKAVLQLS